MQKEWLKVISMLLAMEIEDGLRRGAIMVVAKKIGLAHAKGTFELDIINSSECFSCKKVWKKGYILPSIFFFLARCGGRLPHEVLWTSCFMFPLSNHTE